MRWNLFRKEFKMLWKVQRDNRISYLAGCAHFFPVNYTSALKSIIEGLELVMFEGPLDEGNMDAIRELSVDRGKGQSIKKFINEEILESIEKELKTFYYKGSFGDYLGILKPDKISLFDRETEGLSAWMAFFRIWSIFLRNRGWNYSVDIDAHTIAKKLGKKIIYLETIEEQITALEAIPIERIVKFISLFHKWEDFAKNHARLYKRGDLDKMLEITTFFPTRYPSIIEKRDPVLFNRMKDKMDSGGAIAFVGITHIKGLTNMFLRDGFNVEKVM